MKSFLTITGLLALAAFPVAAQAADYAPCANITDATAKYQCRRVESMSHLRQLNTEFRRTSRPTILAINDGYAKELKTLYRDYTKLSSPERKVFIDQLKDRRLASYLEWHIQEQELRSARQNLRKMTRMPNNKELRIALIKEKGVFLDAKGNMKQTRRTVVEQQLQNLRKYSK